MESSNLIATWSVVFASIFAEAIGTSSENQIGSSHSGVVAAIAPLFIVSLAVCIIAVAAMSIRVLRQPPTKSSTADSFSTTIDVNALAPPSFTLNLDDDNILDFDEEEEEEDEEVKEEVKTRRIGNLAQVMKKGKYFRTKTNGLDEFPYAPSGHCRRMTSPSTEER